MTDGPREAERLCLRWIALRSWWIRSSPFVLIFLVAVVGQIIGWWVLAVAMLFILLGLYRAEIDINGSTVATRSFPGRQEEYHLVDVASYQLDNPDGLFWRPSRVILVFQQHLGSGGLDLPVSRKRRRTVVRSLEQGFAERRVRKASESTGRSA